ncbi:MAG TPA: EamA family transporter [Stellaceae bacterium]|nr:EamA family transporter [Stellaceae bacterium]
MQLVLGFILMVLCTVAANLLLKLGAMVPLEQRVLFGLFDWRTLLGFAFFGGSLLIYSWLLGWMPLNLAQSLASLQFVAVILASALVLAEPIPLPRLLGIALIVAGILLASSTYEAPRAGSPPPYFSPSRGDGN